MLLADNFLIMIADNGVATCLDSQSGKVVWTQRLSGSYSASPIYSSGRVYFFDQEGKATVLRPDREYRELAVNRLDGGLMASPAVAGDALFLRTKTHLYRIENQAATRRD